MANKVKDYHILFYGGPKGYQEHRAQITLFGTGGEVAAYVQFVDPEMQFESDRESESVVYMHLPSVMFGDVLDVLRNEKPVYVYFTAGRGFLSTFLEPVGEGEN